MYRTGMICIWRSAHTDSAIQGPVLAGNAVARRNTSRRCFRMSLSFPKSLETLHHGKSSRRAANAFSMRSSCVPRRLRYRDKRSTAGPSDNRWGS